MKTGIYIYIMHKEFIRYRSAVMTIVALISAVIYPDFSDAQLLFHSTRVKTEYQYSDYFKYEYPDPVYFEYPDIKYTQLNPYIADFPEHRFLFRVIQNFDYKTALTLKYQFSDLDKNSEHNIYAAKLDRELTDRLSMSIGSQYTDLKNNLIGWLFEGGLKYNFAGFTVIQPQFSYYSNDDISIEADKSNAYSYSLLVRQALNKTTAIQAKYTKFESEGSESTFNSNTLTGWLSRYLYSETAIHLSFRYHWNSVNVKTYSTEAEVAQYLNWASVVRLMYRYYLNRPESSAYSVVADDAGRFHSHSVAIVLNYLIGTNSTLSAKYRLYSGSRNVKMNTYLLGLERLF
jgi:hypothetical protein